MQYIRPALEYASPSWSPWISDSAHKSLQRVQNDALRSVVGLTARTPIDFVHLEASVEPLKDRFEKNNLLLRERYKRLGTNDARRRLLEKKASVRLTTRKGLRHAINESPDTLQYKVEELKPPLPPWRSTGFLFDAVELAKKKDQYTTEELRLLTEEKVGKLDSEVIIYTDGSTDGNQNRGGAGVYIVDRRTGNEIRRSFAAGEICSSYAAENVALLRALEWLEVNSAETATICTDSMSIHEALANDDWKDAQDWVRKVKEKSYVLTGKITILWIPSHCGCEGNETADQLANEGTKLNQADIPVTHDIAQARVRKRKWSVSHDRAKDTYRERRKPKYEVEKE